MAAVRSGSLATCALSRVGTKPGHTELQHTPDRAEVSRAAEEAEAAFGSPDILVNCAGVNLRPPLAELSTADWDLTLAVNLTAPFLLGQRFGPQMAALAARTMVGRNGQAADFAGVAVFLASRASDYVTGQTLYVDGGFSAT